MISCPQENKPLPESILTQFFVTMWSHYGTMSESILVYVIKSQLIRDDFEFWLTFGKYCWLAAASCGE